MSSPLGVGCLGHTIKNGEAVFQSGGTTVSTLGTRELEFSAFSSVLTVVIL